MKRQPSVGQIPDHFTHVHENGNGLNGLMIDGQGRPDVPLGRADRVPPYDEKAEQCVLGCILFDKEFLPKLIGHLDKSDFFRAHHQVAYQVMLDMEEAGEAIDTVTFKDALVQVGQFDNVGGLDFITEIIEGVPAAANGMAYVTIVKQKSALRQIAENLKERLEEVYSSRFTPDEVMRRGADKHAAIEHAIGGPDDDDSNFLPMPTKMADAAFRGVIGDVVGIISPHSEACAEAVLAQLVLALGSRIGPRPHWSHDATLHRCNLYACLVGQTGVGKGIAWNIVKWLVKRADDKWNPKAILSGLTSGEGLIKAALESDGGPILAVEAEFGRTLANKSRDKSNLSHVLRDAFDGGDLRVPTSKDSLYVEDAYFSLIGHITPADLANGMTKLDLENGFANRFFYVNTYRTHLLPDGGDFIAVSEALAPFNSRLIKALDHADRSPAFDMPVKRDAKANNLWAEVYPSLRNRPPSDYGNATMRAAPLVMRLALIYSIMDCRTLISVGNLKSALAFWEYCDKTAESLWGSPKVDRKVAKLIELLDATQSGLCRSDVNRKVGRNSMPPKQLDSLIELAFSTGKYVYKEVKTGGSPKRLIIAKAFLE